MASGVNLGHCVPEIIHLHLVWFIKRFRSTLQSRLLTRDSNVIKIFLENWLLRGAFLFSYILKSRSLLVRDILVRGLAFPIVPLAVMSVMLSVPMMMAMMMTVMTITFRTFFVSMMIFMVSSLMMMVMWLFHWGMLVVRHAVM